MQKSNPPQTPPFIRGNDVERPANRWKYRVHIPASLRFSTFAVYSHNIHLLSWKSKANANGATSV